MKLVEMSFVLFYFIIIAGIGLYTKKRASRSVEDYWVAGHQVGPFVNAFAYQAAISSAAALMGFIGLGYKMGLTLILTIGASTTFAMFLSQFLVAIPLRNSGYMTLHEFFSGRYNSKIIKVVAATITTILFFFYCIPQIQAVGMLGQFLLGINYNTSVIICGIVVILYTTWGGMWAVTFTDFLQGVFLVTAVIVIGVLGISFMGGWDNATAEAVKVQPFLFKANPKIPIITFIGIFFATHSLAFSSPHLIMRFFTNRDAKSGRLSMMCAVIINPFVYTIAYTLIIVAGVAMIPNIAKPDMLSIEMASKTAGVIGSGLLYGGILSAIMSTVSAMLLVVAAAVSRDIISTIRPQTTEKQQIQFGKIAIWTFGIGAILAAMNPFALIGLIVVVFTGAVGSSFYFPLLLGLYWKRANATGAIISMIGGLALYAILYFNKVLPLFGEILVSLPVAALLLVVGSYLSKPSLDSASTEKLFEKMHNLYS